ncbi:MAG: phage tail protein [Opitutales bacterium]|nr:phage tail protein [Opitutales bacterium]
MAPFPANSECLDPYRNFKSRVKWDGRYVAGISKVSALKRSTNVAKHREGGDTSTSRKLPDRTEFEPTPCAVACVIAVRRSSGSR